MTTTRRLCRSGASCQPTTLKEALDCLGHHGARTVRQLAASLGLHEGTLGKQLSLYDEDNYPTIRQVVALTLASGSDALLDYFAEASGGLFVRVPPADATGAQLGASVREYGEMLQVHAAMLEDGLVTPDEWDRFAREADQAMAAIQALKISVQARVVLPVAERRAS